MGWPDVESFKSFLNCIQFYDGYNVMWLRYDKRVVFPQVYFGTVPWEVQLHVRSASDGCRCLMITHSGRTLLFWAQIGLPKWPPAAILKKMKLCVDLKWREIRSSKMAQIGLPKCPPAAIFEKKRRCVLIWNGEKCIRKWFSSHPKWSPAAILWNLKKKRFFVIQNGRWQPFLWKKSKLRIDLKWREMWSKVIFGHPKWPPAAILWTNLKKKLRIDLKWREMRSKVILRHSKWPPAAILWKKKSCVLTWNGEKCDRKGFLVIQNGRAGILWTKKKKKKVSWLLIWNGEKCDRKWFSVIQNGRRQPFCEKELQKNEKLRIDLKWREMRSKFIFGHPKLGGGGGGEHHNGQPVNHSGIYTYSTHVYTNTNFG